MKQHYDITGMTCSACAAHVEKAAQSVPGVTEAQVNLLANKMTCEQADDKLTAQVIAAVQKAGYGASVKGAKQPTGTSAADALKDHEKPALKKRLIAERIRRRRNTRA